MNKHATLHTEESPAIKGPDYVALVIEWEDLGEPAENTAGSGATASRLGQSISDDDPIWSRVDEASAESFPASDPPAWGSSHAVAAAGVPEDISDEVTAPFRSSPHGARRLAMGVVAVAALLTMIRGLRRLRR
ncbi:MAG TPA: hypothetical protein VNO30_42500 [Kofleriaceae bacterium]|nr:hypothetical protein [Kofleriaceae bacterium]